jgi:hypothetical protein
MHRLWIIISVLFIMSAKYGMVIVEIYIDHSASCCGNRYVFSFSTECKLCNKLATTNLFIFIHIVTYATLDLSNYVLRNLQYMYRVSNLDSYKVFITCGNNNNNYNTHTNQYNNKIHKNFYMHVV